MFEKYDAYKDSGDKWIGKIPTDWFNERLGTILEPISIKGNADKDLLSITREKGVILRDVEDDSENHNFIPDDLSNYKLIEKGQFGMNKMKAWQGSYGVSPYTGIVSPAYYIFRFIKPIYPDFFHWAIRSKTYISFFGSASDGVRIGQWDLSKDRMKNIPFVFPNIDSQKKIVEFIQDKTGKIDQAIAIKEQQIDLLNERKQIVIQKAVTQGLDPNVPMKDSGVEWIGQIPEHWKILKFKRACQFIYDGTHGSYPRVEQGYRLLSVRNIIDNEFVFREDDSCVSHKHFKEISSKFLIRNDDIQLAIVGGTLGKAAIVKNLEEDIVTQRSLATLRTQPKVLNPNFLLSFIRSPKYQNFLWANAGFSAQPGVYLNTIQNSYLCMPCLKEQTLITEYIETETTKFSYLIGNIKEQIEKLKEYKTTLINDAVTGKIKVA